jgi:hypothetical protein
MKGVASTGLTNQELAEVLRQALKALDGKD